MVQVLVNNQMFHHNEDDHCLVSVRKVQLMILTEVWKLFYNTAKK